MECLDRRFEVSAQGEEEVCAEEQRVGTVVGVRDRGATNAFSQQKTISLGQCG